MTEAELQHQQRELNDQLFRLKFQLKMGQTESLTKLRGLRKDVARIKTIQRQKQLGIVVGPKPAVAKTAASAAVATAPAPAKKAAAKPAPAKKAAAKTARKK
ncbi:MAG TPA: 50S ribosomal protein L29 [Alphaproteobacteria bacterium]|nr:50S ribosomal protein L29 [Alphaproteobacteria bacterium]